LQTAESEIKAALESREEKYVELIYSGIYQ